MGGLAPLALKKWEKFLRKVGCRKTRQKGSHRVYWRDGLIRPVVFPAKNTIPVAIIRSNLRTLGLSVDEFLAILGTL